MIKPGRLSFASICFHITALALWAAGYATRNWVITNDLYHDYYHVDLDIGLFETKMGSKVVVTTDILTDSGIIWATIVIDGMAGALLLLSLVLMVVRFRVENRHLTIAICICQCLAALLVVTSIIMMHEKYAGDLSLLVFQDGYSFYITIISVVFTVLAFLGLVAASENGELRHVESNAVRLQLMSGGDMVVPVIYLNEGDKSGPQHQIPHVSVESLLANHVTFNINN